MCVKVLNSFDVISPVTNAFCSCPLIPVFRGPMVTAALLRHTQIRNATMINKRAAPVTISTYLQMCSKDDARLLDDCAEIVDGEPVASALGDGDGTCAEDLFVLFRGTAGTVPLLCVNWGPAAPGGGPFGAGAAARLRLLKSWISLRCRKLTSAWDSLVHEAPALNLRLQSNQKRPRFQEKNITLKISLIVYDHYDYLQLQGAENVSDLLVDRIELLRATSSASETNVREISQLRFLMISQLINCFVTIILHSVRKFQESKTWTETIRNQSLEDHQKQFEVSQMNI